MAHACGLPAGVLNVVHGLGSEAGAALVEHPDVDLVSFTGSAATGRARSTSAPRRRLAKVCLELGGKNALVVCDDADLDLAVHWAAASAFSNAGQRCAAASRIVVFDAVYDEFRERLVEAAAAYPAQPVISEESLERILLAVRDARRGRVRACSAAASGSTGPGWHLAPTVVEGAAPDATLSCTELFGPVAALYRVRDLAEALALVNDSPYGLTAAIHTASLHRAMRFAERAQAGVVVVNGGTHGSEPHMGFGGVKAVGYRVEGGGRRGARRLLGRSLREPRRRPGPGVSSTVAVLGVGGVGGMLAARLAAAGHRVVCVATPASAAAIRDTGLELETPDGARAGSTRRRWSTSRSPCGLLVVAVKAPALAEALERIEVFAVADGVALTLLNGLEHPRDRAATARPARGAGLDLALSGVTRSRRAASCRRPPSRSSRPPRTTSRTTCSTARSRRLRDGRHRRRRRGRRARGAVGEGGPAGAARRGDGRLGPDGRRAALRSASGARGWRRRSSEAVRRRRRRRRRHDTGVAVGHHRGHARHADDLHGARRRRTAGRRSSTRSPGPCSAPATGSASRARCSRQLVAEASRVTTAIALIGARSGSERVPGKNVRPLAGHPLLAYAICTAQQAGVFDRVVVSTDSEAIADVARWYGADVPFLRPAEYATATSPDIEWIADLLGQAAGDVRRVRDRACHQPVPRARRDPARAGAAARDAGGRLGPRRRARQAASRARCGRSTRAAG